MFYTWFLFFATIATVFSSKSKEDNLLMQSSYFKLISKDSLNEMISRNSKIFTIVSKVEVPQITLHGSNEVIEIANVTFKLTPLVKGPYLLKTKVDIIEDKGAKINVYDIKFKINGEVNSKPAYVEGNITNFYCVLNFTTHSKVVETEEIFLNSIVKSKFLDCDAKIKDNSIKITVDGIEKEDNEMKQSVIYRFYQFIPIMQMKAEDLIQNHIAGVLAYKYIKYL